MFRQKDRVTFYFKRNPSKLKHRSGIKFPNINQVALLIWKVRKMGAKNNRIFYIIKIPRYLSSLGVSYYSIRVKELNEKRKKER